MICRGVRIVNCTTSCSDVAVVKGLYDDYGSVAISRDAVMASFIGFNSHASSKEAHFSHDALSDQCEKWQDWSMNAAARLPYKSL
jgi:hypothetical protein